MIRIMVVPSRLAAERMTVSVVRTHVAHGQGRYAVCAAQGSTGSLINADDQNREQAAAAQAEHQDKPRHGDRRL